MKKLIKYEIKGTYKFILGLLLAILLSSLVIQYNLFAGYDGMEATVFNGILLFISGLVIWGGFIAAFFYIVNSFNNEISQDRGYLTFTLPVTGNQILGSKAIVASIWYIFAGLIVILFNLLLASFFMRNIGLDLTPFLYRLSLIFKENLFSNILSILSLLIYFGIIGLANLLLIYFSMTLRRISFNGNKYGGLWFVIYVILSIITGYISIKLGEMIPYYFDVLSLKVVKGGQGLMSSTGFVVSIGHILLNIVLVVGTFFGTGYLIENKIDL